MIDRRELVAGATLTTLLGGAAAAAAAAADAPFGRVGRILVASGQRDALAALLMGGATAMPGCLSYVVAADVHDADALWVFETWRSQEDHDASLTLPAVRDAIAKARPLVTGYPPSATLRVLGGVGVR